MAFYNKTDQELGVPTPTENTTAPLGRFVRPTQGFIEPSQEFASSWQGLGLQPNMSEDQRIAYGQSIGSPYKIEGTKSNAFGPSGALGYGVVRDERFYDQPGDAFYSPYGYSEYQAYVDRLRGKYGPDLQFSQLNPEEVTDLTYRRNRLIPEKSDMQKWGEAVGAHGPILGTGYMIGGGVGAGGASAGVGSTTGGAATSGTVGAGSSSLGPASTAIGGQMPAATDIALQVGGAAGGLGAGASQMGGSSSGGTTTTTNTGGGNVADGGMTWQDYAAIGGDVLGAYGQYQGQQDMLDAQARAAAEARAAGAYAGGLYDPYREAGLTGLAGLGGMGSFDPTADPVYMQQLGEIERVMNRRNAAQRMGPSSADLLNRAAASSNLFNQAYNRAYQRSADLTNLGQYGTTGAANARLGLGNTLGDLALRGGQVTGAQTAGLYGGLGDVLAAPAQYQANQDMLRALRESNRGY